MLSKSKNKPSGPRPRNNKTPARLPPVKLRGLPAIENDIRLQLRALHRKQKALDKDIELNLLRRLRLLRPLRQQVREFILAFNSLGESLHKAQKIGVE